MRTILVFLLSALSACVQRPPEYLSCSDMIAGDMAITSYTIGPGYMRLYIRNTTLFPIRETTFFVSVTSPNGTVTTVPASFTGPPPDTVTSTTLKIPILPLKNEELHWLDLGCAQTRIDTVPLLANGPSSYRLATAHQTADINNLPASWCPTGPDGACLHRENVHVCRTGTGRRPINMARPGDLAIHAIMANPAEVADHAGEWVALRAIRNVDLNGLAIQVNASPANNIESENHRCIPVTAGSQVKLARRLDPAQNGGLTNVVAALPVILPNRRAPQTLAILDQAGETITSVTFRPTKAGQTCTLR